jgi:hypothetical protein
VCVCVYDVCVYVRTYHLYIYVCGHINMYVSMCIFLCVTEVIK